MINVVTKFLHNDIADLSVFDAELEHHEFDDVTVIKCNHRTTVSTYINAVSSSASTTVVLDFNDHFWYGDLAKTSTDYEFNRISISLDDIITVTTQFMDKHFVLLTENYYTLDELGNLKPANLDVVVCPSYMYEQFGQYRNAMNAVSKSWDSNTHVLCLNNKPRIHRVGVVLYLLLLNLNTVFMSFMSRGNWEDNTEYDIRSILSYVYQYSKLKDQLVNVSSRLVEFQDTAEYVYSKTPTNSHNFIANLLPVYKNTAVEIITETTAAEGTAHLTEKYVNCVFGKCFPIIIGTFKNVELYRSMGYDMFDDIIDHSYDYEPNPFYRMKMAIDANIEIISDRDLAISLHEENKERFENNIQNYIAQYDIILGNTLGELDAFI